MVGWKGERGREKSSHCFVVYLSILFMSFALLLSDDSAKEMAVCL